VGAGEDHRRRPRAAPRTRLPRLSTHGTVRSWLDGEGWGIIDSPDTPGGCWAHFSVVQVSGYRRLTVGEQVEFDWEAGEQDGFASRALRIRPAGQEPVEQPASTSEPSDAYRSVLTIEFDESD
jgi:CspA family cold shock protein